MAKKTQTAVSYLRVSGKGQVGGDGFPRQREAITRFAKANGFTIAAEYCERGVTGTDELGDREALSDLLERIAGNGVRVVLVENAGRLARDLMIQEMILDQLRKMGVSVIASDGTDLTVADGDPTRKLIRQVLGAVAEWEKSMLVAKLRASRDRRRRREGRCEGRKPFGSRPGEKDVVERILALRRKPRGGKRKSFAQIANELNAAKVPTRYGGPWKPGTVASVVSRNSGM